MVAFLRKDKFELKECETINFHDPHDRVAIMALLKMRHFAQFVLVGCTHLWWNAKYVMVDAPPTLISWYHLKMPFTCGCSRKVDHQMSEVFEWEEEVIRMSSDVRDKYERDIATTATGPDSLPVRTTSMFLAAWCPCPNSLLSADRVMWRFQQLARITRV